MLEPIRQFAAERLDEAGDGDAVRRKLVLHLSTETEAAQAAGADMLAIYGPYRDILTQALEYAADLGEWERGLVLADAVVRPVFVPARGTAQLRPWVARAESESHLLSDVTRARLLRVSTWSSAADAADALARWREALTLLDGSDDLYLRAESHVGVALNASMMGLSDLAATSLAAAEELDCPSPVVRGLIALARAQVAVTAASPDALDLYAHADDLAAATRDFALIVQARGDRAYSAALLGDHATALTLAESTVALADERGAAAFSILHTAAVAALALDRIDVAARHLQRILVAYEQFGDAANDYLLAIYLHAAAAVAAANDEATTAARLLGGAQVSLTKVSALDSEGVRCYEHHLAGARNNMTPDAWAREKDIGAASGRSGLLRMALDTVARRIQESAGTPSVRDA